MDKRMAAANITAGNIKIIGTDCPCNDEKSDNSVMIELPEGSTPLWTALNSLDALGLKLEDATGYNDICQKALETKRSTPEQSYACGTIKEMLREFNTERTQAYSHNPKDYAFAKNPDDFMARMAWTSDMKISSLIELTDNIAPNAFTVTQRLHLNDKGIKKLHTGLAKLGVSHPVIEAAYEIIQEKEGKGAPGTHSKKVGRGKRGPGDPPMPIELL